MFSLASEQRLSQVHPELALRIRKLDSLLPALSIQITQGLRTFAEEDALYAQGRTVPGAIVTNVRGGYSAHNFGYALDVVPEDVTPAQPDWNLGHPAWQQILATAPSCGLAEGAQWRTFKDSPHLYLKELPADPTQAMRAQFSSGGLGVVWANFPVLAE